MGIWAALPGLKWKQEILRLKNHKTIDSTELLISWHVIILGFFSLVSPLFSHWRQTPYFSITNTTLSAQWEPESLRYIPKSRPGGLRSISKTMSAQLLAPFPFPPTPTILFAVVKGTASTHKPCFTGNKEAHCVNIGLAAQ